MRLQNVSTRPKTDVDAAFNRSELLVPELQLYAEQTEHGLMVRHPLHFAIMATEEPSQANSLANFFYRKKLESVKEAEAEKKWSLIIWLHERAFRIHAFRMWSPNMTDEQYWKTLRDIWMDSENIWQARNLWMKMLRANRPGRENLMTPEEAAHLASLPDKLTVYRGCIPENKKGVSWTLSRTVAEKFAFKFGMAALRDDGIVLERTVRKKNILAYLTERQEEEVMIVKGL